MLSQRFWCGGLAVAASRTNGGNNMENTSTGSLASPHERPWLNTSLSPDERAARLLAQMTLEEKVSIVHGHSIDATYYTAPIARLGIPALTMTDGPAGITAGKGT